MATAKKTPTEPKVVVDDAEGDTAEPVEPSKFYCPGCGKRTDNGDEVCVGGEFGHAPIAVVSTDELDGPEEGHTPAPPSE